MNNPTSKRPCVFFDRDGIVNRYPGEGLYVETLEQFELLPPFFEALELVLRRGYESVVITNQRGVSKGITSPEALEAMHTHLLSAVKERRLRLLDIMVCVDMDNESFNRKPNPGMLLEAAERHNLDISKSWMIGDDERDILAGRRAGCVHTVLVETADKETKADERVSDMPALVMLLDRLLPQL